ncbi:MAG: TonB-dependent receptor [Bacteroidetes bacterium]|nr:TonB-dependent receptor [Bacteroidota bacterium]
MKRLLLLTPFIFIFFFLSLPSQLTAQTGTIRGFVYETETGEPVIFTNVYFSKTTYGAATDINGYFVISKVPPGKYTLLVTYLGFDTLKIAVNILPNDLITKKLYLKKSTFTLEEVNVSAARENKKVETQISIIKITPREIQQIPTIGGQPDLAQYLQVLPGVIFTGDQGGQLYIRGGPPIQNKVLLDGMTVYNPFHSIGLFSVFDVDIIKNVDVYTGGYGAEYGGRISSVMDITTRDGNKKRFSGKIDASTFGGKLLIEGPIVKSKEDDGTSASFIFSIKDSYLRESSKTFYSYIDKNGLPYDYLDAYGKISINAANGSKVNFYGFDFTDAVQYKILQNYRWDAVGGGGNFIVIPGKSPVLLEGFFNYSNYKVTLDQKNFPSRSSSIGGFNAGLNFSYFFGKDAFKYGLEFSGLGTTLDFTNNVNNKIDYTQNTTEVALYAKYKWLFGKFILEPGIRVQYYGSLSEVSLEPRISAKYNLADVFRLKLAAGLYSQNLISTTYDLDVVNLFYGFLSGPENLPSEFQGKNINTKLQKSQQVVFGFEWDLTKKLYLNVEGYYKYYPQLTNLNRHKIYPDITEYSNPASSNYKPDYLRKDFIIEKGDAEGIDFSLKYSSNNFTIWAVYSLCYIHRFDEISWYVPPYDRRHNINLTSTYVFGKKKGWEFDLRYNFGSGFPFTKTQGFYEQLVFDDLNTNIITNNGNLGVVYSGFDKGRLPYYSRLDANLKKKFELGKYAKIEISLSVTNLLNQQNIFYFDRVSYTRVNQMPLMPSLGLSISF